MNLRWLVNLLWWRHAHPHEREAYRREMQAEMSKVMAQEQARTERAREIAARAEKSVARNHYAEAIRRTMIPDTEES